jgi:hypothetical protein
MRDRPSRASGWVWCESVQSVGTFSRRERVGPRRFNGLLRRVFWANRCTGEGRLSTLGMTMESSYGVL